MRIIRGRPQKSFIRGKSVVTVGVFDGMHRGHVRLIREVVRRARQNNAVSVVVTFSPHPIHVLRPKSYCPLIISLEYRLKLLEDLGVDVCLVIPFRKSFARLSPKNFIEEYLVSCLKASEVIVGDDFLFGQGRQGTIETFRQSAQEYGLTIKAVPTKVKGLKKFSSTQVRENIVTGHLAQAARVLGRPVSLLGQVVPGDARGRRLGYPTANINPSHELLPPSGVYIVRVLWRNKVYPGVASIGRRPTFKKISSVNVEAHIFHFHKDLYGQRIVVEFLNKIRDEKIFQTQEDLVRQIQKDELFAKQWFAKTKRLGRVA